MKNIKVFHSGWLWPYWETIDKPKNLPRTNTLAYLVSLFPMKEKSFVTLTLGANVSRLFYSSVEMRLNKLEAFQLMGKARSPP